MKSSEKFRRLLYPTTTKIIKNFPVYTKKLLLLWVLLWVSTASLHAQKSPVYDVVNNYLRSYKLSGYQPRDRMGMDSLRTDDNLREVRIYANEPFKVLAVSTPTCNVVCLLPTTPIVCPSTTKSSNLSKISCPTSTAREVRTHRVFGVK